MADSHTHTIPEEAKFSPLVSPFGDDTSSDGRWVDQSACQVDENTEQKNHPSAIIILWGRRLYSIIIIVGIFVCQTRDDNVLRKF